VQVEPRVSLAPLTTLGLGGEAAEYREVLGASEAVEEVRAADAAGRPLFILGGGSNVVIADDGFPGVVVHLRSTGVSLDRVGDEVEVTVEAGHGWDEVVEAAIAEGLAGLECLSGIPGSAGATPIQNVGAYGQEVAEVLRSVTAYDRRAGEVVTLPASACAFSYRHSLFKTTDRYVILSVTYRLPPRELSRSLMYPELTRALGVPVGGSAPLEEVRKAVLALRRGKGMVIDPSDPDTRSAGSFFTNPILDAEGWSSLVKRAAARHEAAPPAWEMGGGRVKTSAAWLIERAGFARGYGHGPVGISTKHSLALVHRGGGSTAELLHLAAEVRDGVEEAFGVRLTNEPVLVGVEW
jgi:UDP-N-acetylmuramate dehydrogenase